MTATTPRAGRPRSAEETVFAGAGRQLWDALPAFLVTGTAACVVTGLVLWFAPGLTPVSVLLYAALLAPAYGALVSQAHDALAEETPGAFSFGTHALRTWRLSLALFGAPAITTALTLVSLLVWSRTGSALVLAPLAVGASTSALLAVAAMVGMPLAVSEPRLRGVRLVLAALSLAAKRPVPVAGIAAVAVLGIWAATQFSGTILFLMPAPLAVVSVLAVRQMSAVFRASAESD